MDTIRVDINREKNEIRVYNNGKGIPVEEHKDEKMFVPTLIFGHLLTSSNFNDEEEKVSEQSFNRKEPSSIDGRFRSPAAATATAPSSATSSPRSSRSRPPPRPPRASGWSSGSRGRPT